MKRTIIYLSFNGVFNYTNGIGTQTKTLLSGIDSNIDYFQKRFGRIDLHIITPEYSTASLGFDIEHIQYARSTTQRLGGGVHTCAYAIDNSDFWSTENWERLCFSAALKLNTIISDYDEILTISIDPPFMQAPLVFEKLFGSIHKRKMEHLIAMYSSSYIHDKQNINSKRLSWEYLGVSSSRLHDNIWLADIGNFLTHHYIESYGAPKNKWAPYRSSLILDHEDFDQLSEETILSVLVKYGIPTNKNIILAFGRADWIKGFDILINSLSLLKRDDLHLVLITVPYTLSDPILDSYKLGLAKSKISYSLFTSFIRELPKAVCQYKKTKVVACPSRGEPLSNIPLEVALWAKNNGPVVICSNVDGFNEQIINNNNGFLFQDSDSLDLKQKIEYVLSLDENELNEIKTKAYNKVIKERDFFSNFTKTLEFFWK